MAEEAMARPVETFRDLLVCSDDDTRMAHFKIRTPDSFCRSGSPKKSKAAIAEFHYHAEDSRDAEALGAIFSDLCSMGQDGSPIPSSRRPSCSKESEMSGSETERACSNTDKHSAYSSCASSEEGTPSRFRLALHTDPVSWEDESQYFDDLPSVHESRGSSTLNYEEEPLCTSLEVENIVESWIEKTAELARSVWTLEQRILQEQKVNTSMQKENIDLKDELAETERQLDDVSKLLQREQESSSAEARNILKEHLEQEREEKAHIIKELEEQKLENAMLKKMLVHEAKAFHKIVRQRFDCGSILVQTGAEAEFLSCSRTCFCDGNCGGKCAESLLITSEGSYVL